MTGPTGGRTKSAVVCPNMNGGRPDDDQNAGKSGAKSQETLIVGQFGPQAAAYVASAVHSRART